MQHLRGPAMTCGGLGNQVSRMRTMMIVLYRLLRMQCFLEERAAAERSARCLQGQAMHNQHIDCLQPLD